jgi:glycosyltransferase involved in cell wall biosynthesis
MTKQKKRVLCQLPCQLTPVDNGAKQRIIGTLEYFRARYNSLEVDVIASNSYGEETWDELQKDFLKDYANNIYVYQGERALADRIVSRSQSLLYQRILKRQLPIDTKYFTPPGYRKFVQDIANQTQYDFVWIHYLDFAHLAFVDSLKAATKVIDICDIACRIRLARQNIAHMRGLKFDYDKSFQREVEFLRKFDHVLNNSLDELAELAPHIESQHLTLIPHLLKGLPDREQIPDYGQRVMQYDLLFVGAPYGPNVDGMNFFLAEVFPKIIECCPDVKLAIVGKVGEALDILEAVSRNVDCLGFVPDLGAVYLAARVVICPLLSGSGTKVKLQEAMAYGVPIVTTSVGASGLAFEAGVNAAIEDEAQAFAAAVVVLLQDERMAASYSRNVMQTFARDYAEAVIYARLDRILGLEVNSSVESSLRPSSPALLPRGEGSKNSKSLSSGRGI